MKTTYYLSKSLRPTQWIKQGFILLPLIFAQKVFHYPSLLKSLEAVAIFCLLTGAIYLINDLVDVESVASIQRKGTGPCQRVSFLPALPR